MRRTTTCQPERPLSQRREAPASDIPFAGLPSPAEIIDLRLLEDNLRYLHELGEAAGVKILLAQKAYSLFSTYPLIGHYLRGTCSSGLYEAKLAQEHMPEGEIHVFSPAYKEGELDELLEFADVIIFNSPSEWQRWRKKVLIAQKERKEKNGHDLSFGLRVNPEYSEIAEEIYNPSAKGSRLGTTLIELEKALAQDEAFWHGLSGLHFHSLCEEGAEELEQVLQAFDEKFAPYIEGLSWLNFGGGHHFTKKDYNVELFFSLMDRYKAKYKVPIYLEPGEAIPLDCGFLFSRVLDVGCNQINFAILDSSAACHMPDVLEMPYRPKLFRILGGGRFERAGVAGEFAHSYRLGGPTCLAGDIIGDYSFSSPLSRGDMLVFCDMSLYSHVKRNSFNGMPLPDLLSFDGKNVETIRKFTYYDFKTKLGDAHV